MRCRVYEHRHGALTVRFYDRPGVELYLDGDVDQAEFAFSCGLLKKPSPSKLDNVDWDDAKECGDEWLDVATPVNADETDAPPDDFMDESPAAEE